LSEYAIMRNHFSRDYEIDERSRGVILEMMSGLETNKTLLSEERDDIQRLQQQGE